MGVFHFRLATLLKMREAERDESRLRLAEALEAERILLAKIEELELERGRGRARRGDREAVPDVHDLPRGRDRDVATDVRDREAGEAAERGGERARRRLQGVGPGLVDLATREGRHSGRDGERIRRAAEGRARGVRPRADLEINRVGVVRRDDVAAGVPKAAAAARHLRRINSAAAVEPVWAAVTSPPS